MSDTARIQLTNTGWTLIAPDGSSGSWTKECASSVQIAKAGSLPAASFNDGHTVSENGINNMTTITLAAGEILYAKSSKPVGSVVVSINA